MQKKLIGLSLSFILLLGLAPSLLQAAALTQEQIQAVTAMVRSFGASETVAKNVQMSLEGKITGKATQTSAQTLPKTDRPVSIFPQEPGDVDPGSDDTACVALTTNLRYRASDRTTGGQVSLLQDFLQTKGYFNQEPSGFFGVLTLQAVKKFQKSVMLSPTGFVGSLTRAKIKGLTCDIPPPIACTTEAKQCSDGSWVSRVAPRCEFQACPSVVPPIQPSITVLSPNGGETWAKGTKQTIKWQDNTITTVPTCTNPGWDCPQYMPPAPRSYDIKLATYYPPCTGPMACIASSPQPYTIAKGVSGYSYIWNVGLVRDLYDALAPDGSYTVQVCQSGTNTCDLSDSYFKIYSTGSNLPPVIDGVSGPTTLNVGEMGTWSVKAHDPENGNLSYLVNWGDGVNSGSTGTVATSPMSVSASQTTTFTHSYSTAGAYKVMFTVTDNKGLTAQSSISVQVGNTTQPSITVLSPNGGESWQKGTAQEIKWYGDGRVNIDISNYLSCWETEPACMAPAVIYPIARDVSVERKRSGNVFNWTTGKTASGGDIPAGEYKVTVSSATNGSVTDQSDSAFTITALSTQPSITVLSPNGGEVWPVGSTQVIKWNNTSGGPVNLTPSNYLSCWSAVPSCGAPAVLYQLANNLYGSNYFWTTGKTASGGDIPAGEYKVTVSSATNGSITDQSDSVFTITAPSTQPSITVLSPNGGEVWPVGSTQTIKWQDSYTGCTTNSNGVTACVDSAQRTYNITLSNYLSCWTSEPACMAPAILYQIAIGVSGSSYNWTVGKDKNGGDIPSGQYKVTVSSATNGSVTDQSDSVFTVVAPAPVTPL